MAKRWTDKNGIRHFDDRGGPTGKTRRKRCNSCDGTGWDPNPWTWLGTCDTCGGRGTVVVMRLSNGDEVAGRRER